MRNKILIRFIKIISVKVFCFQFFFFSDKITAEECRIFLFDKDKFYESDIYLNTSDEKKFFLSGLESFHFQSCYACWKDLNILPCLEWKKYADEIIKRIISVAKESVFSDFQEIYLNIFKESEIKDKTIKLNNEISHDFKKQHFLSRQYEFYKKVLTFELLAIECLENRYKLIYAFEYECDENNSSRCLISGKYYFKNENGNNVIYPSIINFSSTEDISSLLSSLLVNLSEKLSLMEFISMLKKQNFINEFSESKNSFDDSVIDNKHGR